jgi:hypothetical protein
VFSVKFDGVRNRATISDSRSNFHTRIDYRTNVCRRRLASDPSLVLTRQLIAAKLNVLRFGPNVVGSAIRDSDRLLTSYGRLLPYRVGAKNTCRKGDAQRQHVLGSYDSDALTPRCVS